MRLLKELIVPSQQEETHLKISKQERDLKKVSNRKIFLVTHQESMVFISQ